MYIYIHIYIYIYIYRRGQGAPQPREMGVGTPMVIGSSQRGGLVRAGFAVDVSVS